MKWIAKYQELKLNSCGGNAAYRNKRGKLMAYSEKVIEHFENPKNIGSLDSRSKSVGSGLVGAPECGDVMKLQIQAIDNTQIVEELSLPPVKIHCSVLAEDAIKSAIADYKSKQTS
jgi:nitrogen fixation NifU-like protein